MAYGIRKIPDAVKPTPQILDAVAQTEITLKFWIWTGILGQTAQISKIPKICQNRSNPVKSVEISKISKICPNLVKSVEISGIPKSVKNGQNWQKSKVQKSALMGYPPVDPFLGFCGSV